MVLTIMVLSMNSATVTAGELTVGDEVAAADGYLFTVKAIVRVTRATVTLLLGSDFSPICEIRAGVEKTMRKSSRVAVVCGGKRGCGDCSECLNAMRASYAAAAS